MPSISRARCGLSPASAVLLLIILLGVLTPTFAVEEAVPEDIVPEVRQEEEPSDLPAGWIPPTVGSRLTLAPLTRRNFIYMSCHGDKSAGFEPAVETRSLL